MYIAMLLLFLGFEKLLEKLLIKITIVTFLIFMALFHLEQPKRIKKAFQSKYETPERRLTDELENYWPGGGSVSSRASTCRFLALLFVFA